MPWITLRQGIITVILAVVIYLFASNALAFYKSNLQSIEFGKLSSSVQKQIDDNWNSLISNIKTCKNITDYNCTCEGFPNFPATFSTDFKIRFDGKKITLFYKNAKTKEAEIENFLAALFVGEGSENIIIERDIEEGYIDFKGVVVGERAYPLFTTINLPVITDKFYKTSPNTVAFVFSKYSETISEYNKSVSSRPQCLNWRQSETIKFEDFVKFANSKAPSEYKISLKEDFKFYISATPGEDKSVALLRYETQTVKQYDSSLKKSTPVTADVPFPCDWKSFELTNEDSVNLTQKEGKFCLMKIQ